MKNIDAEILQQAAQWLLKIRSTGLNQAQQQQFEAWRQQDSQHARAWQRAERLLQSFNFLPENSQEILQQSQYCQQRGWRKLLLIACCSLGLGYLWQQNYPLWHSDYASRVGEHKQIRLAV